MFICNNGGIVSFVQINKFYILFPMMAMEDVSNYLLSRQSKLNLSRGIKKIPASKLYPSQSEIWLEKLIENLIQWGNPKEGSPVLTTTIIVTSDMYILDGHHRFGQAMLADPSLKMSSLFIPIDFDLLLKIGRTYGNSIGHKQKQ